MSEPSPRPLDPLLRPDWLWLAAAPFLAGVLLAAREGIAERAGWAAVLVHGLNAALVLRATLLAAGNAHAALFASLLFAVGPAPSRVVEAGAGSYSFLGVLFTLFSLDFALSPRPRVALSVAYLAAAVVLEPRSAGAVLLIGLATERWPRWHLLVLPLALLARGLSGDPAAGAAPPAPSLAAFLGGTVEAAAAAIPLGREVQPLLLGLALALALHRGPLGRRVSVWCAALVVFALPWTMWIGVAGPGGALLVALAVSGLMAEAAAAWRARLLPAVAVTPLEAALVVGWALLALR